MRRFFLTLLTVLPLTLSAAPTANLMGLRVQSGLHASHITFILSKKTYGHVKYLPQKKELTVEFTQINKHFQMQQIKLTHSNIHTIKAIEPAKGKLKIIFSLKENIMWKIAFLPKQQNTGEYLKLDILTKSYQLDAKNHVRIKSSKKNVAIDLRQHFESDLLKSFATHLGDRTLLLTKNKTRRLKESALTFVPFEFDEKESVKHKMLTIVIDPGHGGRDAGARGPNGILEKDVVLAIAKRLAREINLQPHMRAVLTRRGDYYVPLRLRLKLARKDAADIFIAIHADAYFDVGATGASVYALSQRGASSEAARWLAQRENYAELDGVELSALQDRSSVLRSVLIDLSQTATIRDSMRLGNALLDSLDDLTPLHHSHVEQAPFVVLKSPDIPSILVETAFISNPQEEKRLTDPNYQQKIANAMFKGINHYVEKYHLHG